MHHPFFKCGKLSARRDIRNLKLRAILRPAKIVAPEEYSFDGSHPTIPLKMFGNDTYGDCVIAARANLTLNFELLEQKKIIEIPDKDVLNEYFKETGGGDDGLVLLDSLKAWRRGWKVGKQNLSISYFAEINRKDQSEVKTTIFADAGCMIGLNLPLSARDEINAGKPWSQTTGKGSKPGSWGGHCVPLIGYTKTGPICRTWAQRQPMTWKFFTTFCDEAYAVLDAIDSAKQKRIIDKKSVVSFLSTL